jgi:hypothetical protein
MHADFRYIPEEKYTPENTAAMDLRQRRIKYSSWEGHHTLLTFKMGKGLKMVHVNNEIVCIKCG